MTKVDLYLSHLSKGQIIRITIGLVFLVLVGMVYLPHLLFTMSVSAIINARTITLTTPIDGYLKGGPPMIGTELQKGERIAVIENPTVDRSTVEGLETDYNSLNERIKALYQEKETLLLLKSQLELSVKQYQDSIENRLIVDIKRAEARHQELINSVQENKRNLTRKDSLFKKGNIAASSLDNAYFATERSEKAAEQAKLELDRLMSELHSIRQGVFINRDGRSEVPYQRQRIDEIEIRLSNVDTRIHEHKARLESLKKRLEFEQDRFKRQERHEMVAPNFSVIWRTFAMEGTHLNAKYPVLELLDCANV
ncbi:MAG: hypothetical protein HYS39_03910 [Proteobacteria bacterium]|nr:hypothetical protein [Pseudomonadota bacterium]